jgi:uncharacterized membrane protein YhaH (DUF805 family)
VKHALQQSSNVTQPTKENWFSQWFSPHGRIGRVQFVLRHVWLFSFVLAIYQLIVKLSNATYTTALGMTAVLGCAGMAYFLQITWIKRLHDLNRTGWLSIVPGVAFFLFILSGTNGPNQYGIERPKLRWSTIEERQDAGTLVAIVLFLTIVFVIPDTLRTVFGKR